MESLQSSQDGLCDNQNPVNKQRSNEAKIGRESNQASLKASRKKNYLKIAGSGQVSTACNLKSITIMI